MAFLELILCPESGKERCKEKKFKTLIYNTNIINLEFLEYHVGSM